KALEAFQNVLALERQMSDHQEETNTLLNIGFVYADVEQAETAQTYFEQALTRARDLAIRSIEASALIGLGTVALQAGHPAHALVYNQQGLAILRKLNKPHEIATVLGNIAAIELASGQH